MSQPRKPRLVRAALVAAVALSIATTGLVVVAGPAVAAAAATATFRQQSVWSTGSVGSFTIANNTAAPLTWRVEFDLMPGTGIVQYWGADVVRSGDHYTVTGKPWNADLAPGVSIWFGFITDGTGVPVRCLLNGGPCDGVDSTPPTRPGNVQLSTSANRSLSWTAATDNVGVAGYDVYFQGWRFGTTTQTSVSPLPPLGVFGTWEFRVVAFDAAGNRSVPAYTQLSADPAPGTGADIDPPTAPTGGAVTLTDTEVAFRWDPSTDGKGIGGYELFQNGDLLRWGPETSFRQPRTSAGGTFRLQVRAYDTSGNRSAMTTIALVVD